MKITLKKKLSPHNPEYYKLEVLCSEDGPKLGQIFYALDQYPDKEYLNKCLEKNNVQLFAKSGTRYHLLGNISKQMWDKYLRTKESGLAAPKDANTKIKNESYIQLKNIIRENIELVSDGFFSKPLLNNSEMENYKKELSEQTNDLDVTDLLMMGAREDQYAYVDYSVFKKVMKGEERKLNKEDLKKLHEYMNECLRNKQKQMISQLQKTQKYYEPAEDDNREFFYNSDMNY